MPPSLRPAVGMTFNLHFKHPGCHCQTPFYKLSMAMVKCNLPACSPNCRAAPWDGQHSSMASWLCLTFMTCSTLPYHTCNNF